MERPKHKRISDPALLNRVRKEQCCIDGCNRKSQAAHIKSKGAGGDDVSTNLAPLCWEHHTEQHTLGWPRFRARYPEVKSMADLHREMHPCWGCVGSMGDCSDVFAVGLKNCESYQDVTKCEKCPAFPGCAGFDGPCPW